MSKDGDKMENIMKNKIKLVVICVAISCLITISSADIGIGISDVGTISSITGIEENNATPSGYCLHQNYPTPFNPSTTIEFSLPKSEFTTLKVYNILGKEVAQLISDNLRQGKHTYNFDGSKLASGVYYYQLVAGEYREVKKMILIH
jgi:hypothetical protein